MKVLFTPRLIAVSAMVLPLLMMSTPVAAQVPSRYVISNEFSADGSPHFPAINPVNNRLYVSDVAAGTVSMFDVETGAKLAETVTGIQAHTVMVDSNLNLVYVANRGSNTLSVLDGSDNQKLADIAVGVGPHGVELDLPNHRAFVSNTGSNDITIVDLNSRTAIGTLPAGTEPWGVAYDGEHNWLYTSNTGDGTVSRIDLATGAIAATIAVGGRPWNVRVADHCKRIYVTNETLGVVSVIRRDKLVSMIPVGAGAHGLVIDEHGGVGYAAATGANQVTVFSLRTNEALENLATGKAPAALSRDPIRHRVYAANQGGGTISVIERRHH